ncbi:MAG: co-chaperone GroES [Patescibacteria group bacterium]
MAKVTSSKINLRPAAGYILIEPVSAQTQTVSGIYLPDSASEKPQKGTVIAIGDVEVTEKGTKASPVKPADVVIYKKWGGNEVKMNGKDYLFVKFEDILATEIQL